MLPEDRKGYIEKQLKDARLQLSYIDGTTGPMVLGVIGAVTIPFMGFGLLLIGGAIIWAHMRSTSQTQLKGLIFQYETELSHM